MIIFIYGEDIYQSQNRLNGLKEKFKEKYGEINFSVFNIEKNEKIDSAKIISEIESIPFLGARRLVIINNLVSEGDTQAKEKIIKKIESIPQSAVVIFYEKGILKKNDRLFRLLLKIAKSEEFLGLKGISLVNWIKKEVVARGGTLEPGAAERLAILADNDTWRLSLEIDKLINYSYPRAIKREDAELLVGETIETKIFDLVDGLARRDGRLALLSLHRLLSQGEKREYLFSMIIYGFRNLILIKYLQDKNQNLKEAEFVKRLSLHPFVVKKTIASARFFSFIELKKIYHRLVRANLELRRADKDPVLVLDLLLSEICAR